MSSTYSQTVRLCVPAEPRFARTVRMCAANLAVVCEMNYDEVEDLRMAAEEGFVFACTTEPTNCEICFDFSAQEVRLSFSLGSAEALPQDTDEDLTWLLLSAVCDECALSEDGTSLVLMRQIGGPDAHT